MEYIASSASTGEKSQLGPWRFERNCFTSSIGHQVLAWGCFDRHGSGVCSARSRTRAGALRRYLMWRVFGTGKIRLHK